MILIAHNQLSIVTLTLTPPHSTPADLLIFSLSVVFDFIHRCFKSKQSSTIIAYKHE